MGEMIKRIDFPQTDPVPDGVEELFSEAAELARGNRNDAGVTDAYWDRVHALHAHHDKRAVADRAEGLLRSRKARDRELGVDVCARLPADVEDEAERRTWIVRMRGAIAPMLAAKQKDVIASTIHAIGHLGVDGELEGLLEHGQSEHAELRFAVACVLGPCSDARAVPALIELSRDEDADVRDYACLGLGTQQAEVDTSELREALFERLEDEHPEVRAEAQLGLARRGDRRVLPFVRDALLAEEVVDLTVEAATCLPSRELLPGLQALAATWPEPEAIDAAIDACEGVREG